MKTLLVIVLALTYVSAKRNLEDIIKEINAKQNLWRPGKNFHGKQILDIGDLLGSKKLSKLILNSVPVVKHEMNGAGIPESFDARTRWPECKSIQEVRDQSACGSCWAVAVSSVITDRICIHSNGTLTPEISAKHLMSCENQFSRGCRGGYPYYSFLFWRDNGLVTGGAYDSKVGCQPYPFPPCEHYGVGPKPACRKLNYKTPECVSNCDNSSLAFNKERYYGLSVYRVKTEPHIQTEIMKNGPVTADFKVFDDFILYKSGVYVRTSKTLKGGHAVRVIGWGVERGTKYWLVMNSWNEDWGDKGLFKIRRGVDECGIEDEVLAGIPK